MFRLSLLLISLWVPSLCRAPDDSNAGVGASIEVERVRTLLLLH